MGQWRILPALVVLTLGIRPGSDKQAKEAEGPTDGSGVRVLASGGLLLEPQGRGSAGAAPARPRLPPKQRPEVPNKGAGAALTDAVRSLHVGEPAPGSAPLLSTGMAEVAGPAGCDASAVCEVPASCRKLPPKTTGKVVDAHVQMVKNTCREYETLCSRAFCQYQAERAAVKQVDDLMKLHWQGTKDQLKELNTSIELSFQNIQELLTQPPAAAAKSGPALDASVPAPAQVEAVAEVPPEQGETDTPASDAGGPAVAVPVAPTVASEAVTEESIPQSNSLVGWNLGP